MKPWLLPARPWMKSRWDEPVMTLPLAGILRTVGRCGLLRPGVVQLDELAQVQQVVGDP